MHGSCEQSNIYYNRILRRIDGRVSVIKKEKKQKEKERKKLKNDIHFRNETVKILNNTSTCAVKYYAQYIIASTTYGQLIIARSVRAFPSACITCFRLPTHIRKHGWLYLHVIRFRSNALFLHKK